jgi:hypothetical protein
MIASLIIYDTTSSTKVKKKYRKVEAEEKLMNEK